MTFTEKLKREITSINQACGIDSDKIISEATDYVVNSYINYDVCNLIDVFDIITDSYYEYMIGF